MGRLAGFPIERLFAACARLASSLIARDLVATRSGATLKVEEKSPSRITGDMAEGMLGAILREAGIDVGAFLRA